MALQRDLLKKGYLPENLPPVFVTADFSEFVRDATNDYLIRKNNRTRPCLYNATKRGHQRRLFSIPNPIAAADTALFLERNWKLIINHIAKSPFSASQPQVDTNGQRAITITSHDELARIRFQRLAACRFVVATDISRFYPSIYTHALPWAYHGKSAAKNDSNPRSSGLYFNRIDYILRQAQDGQTIGIPVGPDSSRVIAEVIASSVDYEFTNQVKSHNGAILRHVDEIWIGADNYDEAEHILYTYRSCLREYELDINELKTAIVPATHDSQHCWTKELEDLLRNEFRPRHPLVATRGPDRISVLDRVFQLSSVHSDVGIVKFALRCFDSYHAWSKHWDVLQFFLLRGVVNYSHSIDYVARVLAWRAKVYEDVDLEIWGEVLHDCLALHARLRNDAEVTWALWLAGEIKPNIRKRVAESIMEHCGALPLMLLYHFIERGVVRRVRNRQEVATRLGDRPLAGSFWMFAYEAWRREWIDEAVVSARPPHELFEGMINSEVSFFNPDAIPSALEGKEEDEWDDIDAIEDIAGEYEDDDEGDEDEEEF